MEGVTGTLRFVKFSKKLPKLKDKELTEVIIMTLPEATPVYEATRLQEDLNRAGIYSKWWIPEELKEEDLNKTLK